MKKRIRQTAAYFGIFFALGAIISSLGPTLPGLADGVGREVTKLSLLFSARSFGYLFGSLLAGLVLGHLPGHRYLALALILSSLCLSLIPQIHTLSVLVAMLFVIGVTLGSFDVSANTLLARVHGKRSGAYLNAMYLSAGAGSFLLPLYLGTVSLEVGYPSVGLLLLPLVAWILITPTPAQPDGDDEDTRQGTNLTVVLLFSLLSFLYVGLEVSYGGWIFTYFQKLNLGPDQTGYTLTSLFWLAITVGRLIAIPTALRVRPIHAIFIYLMGGVMSTGVIVLYPSQTWSVWVGTAGIGLSLAALFPTTFNYIQRTNRFNSKLNGIVWSIGSLGGILLPYLIGQGMHRYGGKTMMIITLISWLMTLFLYFVIIRRNRHLPVLVGGEG